MASGDYCKHVKFAAHKLKGGANAWWDYCKILEGGKKKHM